MSNTLKGYLFVLVSVLAMANVYIFSKAALKEINIILFGFYWFAFALFYNVVFLFYSKKNKEIKLLNKSNVFILVVLGVLEVLGTISFFSAINAMSNPAIVSFLANMAPVLITIFGVIILKERFIKIEILGILLTIGGAMVISFNPGFEVAADFIKGAILIFISNLIYATSTIISKKNIQKINPALLSLNRVVFLFIVSAVGVVVTGQSLNVSVSVIKYISLGSLLGPFLAALAGYTAIKYIEASRSAVIGSSKSLFVLLTAYLYFGHLPHYYQLIGGLITVVGVLLISTGKLFVKK